MYWQGTGCSARTERPGCSYGMAELPMTSKSPWFSSTTSTTWLDRGKVPRGPGLEHGAADSQKPNRRNLQLLKAPSPKGSKSMPGSRGSWARLASSWASLSASPEIVKQASGRANDLDWDAERISGMLRGPRTAGIRLIGCQSGPDGASSPRGISRIPMEYPNNPYS